MTAYWHYCSCGRNAAEEESPKKHVLLSCLAGEFRHQCPDCKEPLTLRVQYTPIDLDAEDRADAGSDIRLICPYCGYENDPTDWREGDDVWECDDCGSSFIVEAEYEVTWFTKRRE